MSIKHYNLADFGLCLPSSFWICKDCGAEWSTDYYPDEEKICFNCHGKNVELKAKVKNAQW